MKNKFNILLILITILSFFACHKTIMKKDLVLSNNLYYENNKTAPFSGKALSRFSSGEISSMYYFKDGLLTKSESYGYANELISQTVYKEIKEVIPSDNHISQIVFTTSNEGAIYYYGIEVILDSNASFDLNTVNNEKGAIIKAVLNKKTLPKNIERITFSIKKGALENSLYTEELVFNIAKN